MTVHVLSALILPLIVLSVPVLSTLSTNETTVLNSYIGSDYKTHKPCLLTAFRASVTIRPINDTFQTTTYSDLSPETSEAKTTECNENIQHYYRFNDTNSDLGTNSLHQSLLSVGFEVSSDRSVTINFKFIQVLCPRVKGCFRSGRMVCNPNMKPRELLASNCYLMSASYHLDWIKANRSHQCSHNSRTSIKDVVYFQEEPVMKGVFDIDVDFYRIDVITDQYSGHFNPVSYCLKDWILDTNALIIFGSVACLIIILVIVTCLVDCRKSAKKSFSNGKVKKCVLEDEAQHESQLINSEL